MAAFFVAKVFSEPCEKNAKICHPEFISGFLVGQVCPTY